MTPTENAEMSFRGATMNTVPGKDLAGAINLIAQGLQHLSVGVRATYLKLEEIEKLLKGSPGSAINAGAIAGIGKGLAALRKP